MLLPNRYRPRLPATAAMAVTITVVACLLRVWAGFGDLWLDEVWSIQLASQVSSPWEIVTQLRSDNNHMLNTAYVAWLGTDQPPLNYRLLSIIAGTLSVLVVGGVAAERGRAEQWTAMVLVATSFLMVHYASEARGYALALLFALTAYWSLFKFLRQRRDRHALCFACCASLGCLSHPTFLYFYLAACFWSADVLLDSIRTWPNAARSLAVLHGLPGFVALVLYLVNFRHYELGGGPTYDLAGVLAQTGSLAVGGPVLGTGAVLGAVCSLAAFLGGLWVLWRDGDTQWKALAFCVVLPLVAAMVTRTPFLFVRYFLVAIVFAHLLFAFGLGWLFRRGRSGQIACAALVILFVAANLLHLKHHYRSQRGHYLAALQFIADHDASKIITIGSNHDHGTSILVDFYRHRLRSPRAIEYCRAADWQNQEDGKVKADWQIKEDRQRKGGWQMRGSRQMGGSRLAGPPNWLILHHDSANGPASFQRTYVVEGQTYRLSKMFDAGILSGWQWFCYRNERQEASLAGKSTSEMLNVATIAER